MEDKLTELIYAQLGIGGLLVAFVAWAFWGLSSELTKLRKEVGYEVNKDLLAKRFEAYGALWAKMKCLAIYTGASFGGTDARTLEAELSEWYFSDKGGLLLTVEAREFYFALQDTLRAACGATDWKCHPRPPDTKESFKALMTRLAANEPTLESCVSLIRKDEPERIGHATWRAACKSVAREIEKLANQRTSQACEEIYCALQQISSILRTKLAAEVRSRLAVELPR
jgi:hypothetical protein